MRKFFVFLCALTVLAIRDCSLALFDDEINPNDYNIEENVEIEETVTFDEIDELLEKSSSAFEGITNADSQVVQYATITYTMSSTSSMALFSDITVVMKMDLTGTAPKLESHATDGEKSIYMYIDEEYFYMDMPSTTAEGERSKQKARIPDEQDLEDMGIEAMSFSEALARIGITEDSEGIKMGYDSAGCFVFDYDNGLSGDKYTRMRYVLDSEGKPVYMYMVLSEIVFNFTYDYNKVKVVFPNDLDTYTLVG